MAGVLHTTVTAGGLLIMVMDGEDLITVMVVDIGATTPTTTRGDTLIMVTDTTTTIMEDQVVVRLILLYVPKIVTVSILEQEVRAGEM